MMPIDPSELTGIAADLQRIMPDTCTITRPGSQATDGAGGFTEAYATITGGSNVPCSVYPASNMSGLANDVQQNNQGKVIGDWIIQLPGTPAVQNRDRILIASSGRLYEVVSHDTGASYSPTTSVKATLVE